jgi:16S rRNA (guanine1516-N2)-methyltransferase
VYGYLTLLNLTITAIPEKQQQAQRLALALNQPSFVATPQGLLLHLGERLELREVDSKTGPVYVDFSALKHKYGVDVRRRPVDLIAKAIGAKQNLSVLDATAGLGQDAFVMALYGCQVRMLERSPIVHALLKDGLERAKDDKDLSDILSRMYLIHADAKLILPRLEQEERPEVIYLDPMYPESGKSAAKRKEMRLFRELVGDDMDVQEVFELALETALNRVVLKRPLKAPTFGKPSFVAKGTTLRFDVYLTKSLVKK